ncbi:MAG: class I SAM-dependent methyltransferase [Polaribacter sp.]|jgi:demethylmacrocin O-methyltransferase|nr:class I SAM-dependent methyltransferase [Polaribacter sp.]MDG2356932.1 class I SAM-dependent methyltransferase [Polaribacter sp.]
MIKNKLSKKSKRLIRNFINDFKALGNGKNLNKLGKIYKTDKIGGHFYTQHYQLHFKKFKYKKINLLEIGVGGYKNPFSGGNSLRMWKKYFPFGNIFSIDIYDKSPIQERKIKIFKGSQVDDFFLNSVLKETGDLDLIIDDGSHINEHVIQTFKLLFPKLKKGGIYVIEDTQTSYWKSYGGDSMNLNNPNTMMNFFKSLTDGLNHKEIINPAFQENYYDKNIVSIHFYHNLIFIYKGDNNEESNSVVNNGR